MDKKQILIVDDEPDVLSVLEKVLAVERYSVITANNGTDAIILAQSKCPDLIILDLVIPDMNGDEILKKLREDPKTKNIPVVFLSSLLSKDKEVERNHSIYGEVLITKPNVEELLAKIKEILSREKIILIVDDEMDLQLVLGKALTKEGYSVITAYNGNNALVLLESECPDLIILDRVLGDMPGEELAVILRETPKTANIPIIFLSALFSKTDEIEKEEFFRDYMVFTKPYNIKELLTAIESLCEKEKMLSK